MSNPMKLKHITTKIGSGATPRGGKNSYFDHGVSFIRSQNVHDMNFSFDGLAFINAKQAEQLDGVTVFKNDILLNITGDSIARTCLVPEAVLPARVNQHVSIIRAKDPESAHYICYYLQHLKDHLLQICRVGGTRNALTKDAIENLDINLPVDHKTRAILLSTLNEKISINNQINIKLDAMAKILYDFWFVQFDFPDANGKPYKTSGGKMIWSEELKREIPDGWKVKKLADWIEQDKSGDWGSDLPSGNYITKVNCIRGADINGLNGLEDCSPPIRYILEKNSNKILNSHDLIIEISGGSPTQSTGRLAYITEATLQRFEIPLICSNFCKAISLKNQRLVYNFAYHWDSLYKNNIFFGHEGKTSGIKNFLFESFVNSHWTVEPSQDVTEKFYAFMQAIDIKKQNGLSENKKLADLRDWLLPMLMNEQLQII